MLPLCGLFPHQLQTSAPPPQQNSMPSQPQLGMNNPQIPVPFPNNSSNYMRNGLAVPMPNMPSSMVTQTGFMNGPNYLLPLQNNHLGMPHLGSLGPMPQQGKPHVGFGPQSSAGSMNSVPAIPVHSQAFGHNNIPNLRQFNQNVGLQFGQFCLPNHPMPNMNQFVPMQMPNLPQFVPQTAIGIMNQVPQATPLQNPSFHPQFGNAPHYNQIVQQVNQNEHNLSLPIATQQVQVNSVATVSTSFQTVQTNNFQPSSFMETQGNPTQKAGANISTSTWRNPSSKTLKNPKKGMMQGGFQNNQFHHVKSGKRNFRFPNAQNGKGLSNEKSGKFGTNSMTRGREHRRSLFVTYTEQEIQQWRDERRRSYPSKANIEKKLAETLLDTEAFVREAKLRQEQLKEILAKQAELGVEVAEIPGCYLPDPKKQGHGREENGRSLTKKGRLRNKFDRRGRNDNRDRNFKKQRLNDDGASTVTVLSMKKQTLLQKLLSADVKRDKSLLLQAFRFMVMNSFFKDWPDKPLKFPSVIVKEGCSEEDDNGMVGNMCMNAMKGNMERTDRTVGKIDDDADHSDDDNGDDASDEDEHGNKNSDELNCNKQEDEEEEGEIIN